MSHEERTKPGVFKKTVVLATLTVGALMLVGVTSAEAICIDRKAAFTGRRFLAPQLQNGIEAARDRDAEPAVSIVGLWSVDLLPPNGDLYDQGFEQWHSDGTELTLDNAVSPAFGNICVGVWKQVGPRTVKLTHVGWNWDAGGKVAGTFWLWMTATLNRNGRSFTATFKTDSYDLEGKVIPELHADGRVRGTRISVD